MPNEERQTHKDRLFIGFSSTFHFSKPTNSSDLWSNTHTGLHINSGNYPAQLSVTEYRHWRTLRFSALLEGSFAAADFLWVLLQSFILTLYRLLSIFNFVNVRLGLKCMAANTKETHTHRIQIHCLLFSLPFKSVFLFSSCLLSTVTLKDVGCLKLKIK